eukprot:12569-Heterococcus_DN1.PRE.2
MKKATAQETQGLSGIGAFFRVGFWGGLPPELKGQEFVYRVPLMTQLGEFQKGILQLISPLVPNPDSCSALFADTHAHKVYNACRLSSESMTSTIMLSSMTALVLVASWLMQQQAPLVQLPCDVSAVIHSCCRKNWSDYACVHAEALAAESTHRT